MDKDTINSLVSEVQHIAENAGNLIMTFFDELAEEEVEYKADQSPVTLADKAANKQIVDELINLDDSIPIISEEGLAQNLDNADIFWLVDPLDGTKEFINDHRSLPSILRLLIKVSQFWVLFINRQLISRHLVAKSPVLILLEMMKSYPPAHQRTHACLPLANAIAREKKLNLPCFSRINLKK